MSSVQQKAPGNVVYIGSFLHCSSLTDLQIREKKAVGVSAEGVIQFIEDEGKDLDQRIKERFQGEPWTVVRATDDHLGFFFPGFVGRFPSQPRHRAARV